MFKLSMMASFTAAFDQSKCWEYSKDEGQNIQDVDCCSTKGAAFCYDSFVLEWSPNNICKEVGGKEQIAYSCNDPAEYDQVHMPEKCFDRNKGSDPACCSEASNAFCDVGGSIQIDFDKVCDDSTLTPSYTYQCFASNEELKEASLVKASAILSLLALVFVY